MSLSNYSYPHPIIGNNDDVNIEIAEDCVSIVEKTTDDFHIYSFEFSLKDTTILELISNHKAKYGVSVKCRSTLYQDKILSESNVFDIQIPRTYALGRVDFQMYVIATDTFVYSHPEANPMFMGCSFDIHQGDPLVFFKPQYDNLEVTYNTLKHYSSILVPVPDERVDDNDIRIEMKEKIEVHLSLKTFALLKEVNTKENTPEIISSIVQTALTTALFKLFIGEDDAPDADDIRKDETPWVEAIVARMNEEGMPKLDDVCGSPFEEIPSLVQKLLQFPISSLLEKMSNKPDSTDDSVEEANEI